MEQQTSSASPVHHFVSASGIDTTCDNNIWLWIVSLTSGFCGFNGIRIWHEQAPAKGSTIPVGGSLVALVLATLAAVGILKSRSIKSFAHAQPLAVEKAEHATEEEPEDDAKHVEDEPQEDDGVDELDDEEEEEEEEEDK